MRTQGMLNHFLLKGAVKMPNMECTPLGGARTFANDSCTSAQDVLNTNKKHVRFEKCIGCTDMGPYCLGPNLLDLTIPELRIWVNKWREHYKLSISKCASAWDMSDGTVARFLSSNEPDFKYATIWSIIHGITYYGKPAGLQYAENPCPATTLEINEMIAGYEKQIAEKTEECTRLSNKKLERANEYTRRMAEQRENYEKNLEAREKSVEYLRELAERRLRELDEEKAQSANYLERIDSKNQQITERDTEIKRLNMEILRLSSAHAAETKDLIDRILRLTEEYASELKTLNHMITQGK